MLTRDPAEAVALFKQAAKAGNVEARFHLGMMRLHGEGVPQNMDSAQQHLLEAATVRPLCLHQHHTTGYGPQRPRNGAKNQRADYCLDYHTKVD